MNRPYARLAAATLIAVVAACGSDDDIATNISANTGLGTTDTASDAASVSTTTGAAVESGAGTASEGEFPVTISHVFGDTTIDTRPERVISIGFGEHDGLLALGVIPIAVRDWYGDQPYATWPWAQDELGDAQPEVLPAAELNFEQIAALRPDLILGISSGITDADYATLSAIAPTIARPAEFIDYGTPWDISLEMAGRALGLIDEAERVAADTKQMFTDAIAEHPEFAGASASVTFYFEEAPGAYVSSDVRSRALTDLGFVIPPEIDELAGDAFYLSISAEDLSLIDTDVVVWIGSGADTFESIRTLPTRPSTQAYQEGREVVADDLLSGAFSHASPLSFEYVIDELVPELALAIDGDPATAVPSAATIAPDGAAVAPATDAAETADDSTVATTWSTVFDSTVGFDAKAALLEDAADLRDTVEAYAEAGSAMGGITLEPTTVTVDGDTATVTYDVLFGGNPAYTDQEGTVVRVDGTWIVPRDEFCSFMASARNPCPAG